MKPCLIWDFDGTLYRGDKPFSIYASYILEFSGMERDGHMEEIERRIGDYEKYYGNDGYEIVATYLSSVKPEIMQKSYERMREDLLEHPEYVEIPEKIGDILEFARERTHMILASNSPEPYVTPFLKKLGLISYFHQIFSSARKPEGIRRIIGNLPEKQRVLSIGDHYVNDIMPAIEMKKDSAFISKYAKSGMDATFYGKKIEDIYGEIIKWIEKSSDS